VTWFVMTGSGNIFCPLFLDASVILFPSDTGQYCIWNYIHDINLNSNSSLVHTINTTQNTFTQSEIQKATATHALEVLSGTAYYLSWIKRPKQNLNNEKINIECNNEAMIWICTDNGLHRYQFDSNVFQQQVLKNVDISLEKKIIEINKECKNIGIVSSLKYYEVTCCGIDMNSTGDYGTLYFF
jgi:hypothetical protein